MSTIRRVKGIRVAQNTLDRVIAKGLYQNSKYRYRLLEIRNRGEIIRCLIKDLGTTKAIFENWELVAYIY